MKWTLALVEVIWVSTSLAAFERIYTGGRSAGMGGSGVGYVGDAWSVFSNPGALSSMRERTLSIGYTPSMYELKELAWGSLSYVEPTSVGTFAFSSSRFGFDLYRETDIRLSYSVHISPDISLGTNTTVYHLSIAGYGNAWTLGVDLGALVRIGERIHMGVVIFNINAPTIGASRERLPMVLSTGIHYTPVRELTLALDLQKDVRHPTEFRVGVEYRFLDLLSVRTGAALDPSTLHAGIGVQHSFLAFDYAFNSHPVLGQTHQFSTSFLLGEL